MFPVGRVGLYTLLVALPIAVEIPPDSTGRNRGNTRITVIGGGGTYSIFERGCEGQLLRSDEYDFREGAGAIEHEFAGGLAVGVRGGMIRQTNKTSIFPPSYYTFDTTRVFRSEYNNEYIQPTIAFEKDRIGVGAGWIWAREPFANGNEFDLEPGPSFHLRIGRRDKVRIELNYMENLPLYSGGGYAEIGIGMHPHRLWDISMAMGTGPFEGIGAGVEVDYRVLPNWSVLGRARAPGGAALGISFATRPPLPPYQNPRKPKDPNDIGWRGGLEAKRPKQPPPVTPAPAPVAPAVAVAALPAVEKYPKYEDYQPLDSLAVPLLRAEPVAPDGATGTVSVAALVDWNGNVVDTRVIQSIPALDAAAIECASRWTFRPAIHEGRRVASWVTIPVRFGTE